jgi:glutaredoxin
MDTNTTARERSWAPWILTSLVAAFALLQAWRSGEGAERVHCDVDRPRAEARAVMLATSWCPYCAQTRAFFERHSVAWCEYDIERTHDGQRLYAEVGVTGIPVILVGERRVLGFDEPRLRHALGL